MNTIVTDTNINMIDVNGQLLEVAFRRGTKTRPPLSLFNGIGSSWTLVALFLSAMRHNVMIIFDIPGLGGSPVASRSYRPSVVACMTKKLIAKRGHEQTDVAGASWGSGAAQQFARQSPCRCGKLALAAMSAGSIMVPGRIRAPKARNQCLSGQRHK